MFIPLQQPVFISDTEQPSQLLRYVELLATSGLNILLVCFILNRLGLETSFAFSLLIYM